MPGSTDTHQPRCAAAAACHVSSPDTPPPPPVARSGSSSARIAAAGGSDVAVAGFLYKWTNYCKGWRPRWFSLRSGVVSYTRTRSPPPTETGDGGAVLIGESSRRFGAGDVGMIGPAVVVHLKISAFRESKSDDRRFYIFSPTKTLHLRTKSRKERVAWIDALILGRSVYSLRSLSGSMPFIQNNICFSTEKLRDRMRKEGLGESLIKDCQQIMLSEFKEFQGQLKLHCEENISLLGSFQQHLEEINMDGETVIIHGDQMRLMKHEFSSSGRGNYSEYSTTESSDDVEKQELKEFLDEDEPSFFDSKERFSNYDDDSSISTRVTEPVHRDYRSDNNSGAEEMVQVEAEHIDDHRFPLVERRNTLPEPIEKEKSVSLWSMIKDNVGKDLSHVCLPVYFNEPLSSLQKCFEELEYSYLLDRAYQYGKMGNSLMRILNVAAFAISGYASSDGRLCKPFNPLLGETYEADYPDKGIHFFSEKVSHHPMIIACHCEGKGWKFSGDSNIRSKFWGRSIQLDPVGVLTLEFDDGETFTWSKVTTNIYNLILGKVYCDHHGIMNIQGNRQYSCKLRFKEQSLLDRNPRQVQGFVEDVSRNKVALLMGKWDDSMYYIIGDDVPKTRGFSLTENASLLWKRSKPPANPTRYNLSSFTITLNELTPGLKEKLPPTDSRLRPDQRCLENGEYQKANEEKLRLEIRQRMSRKLQENGWKPRWFCKDSKDGTFHYIGGYWEAREQKKWEGCPDIFGELS
ncbi:oxysterol-binding protein-related protein 2A-like isoform X1 [Iris pallida]|uniref:Oxysterol-binding protein-related protein 2A-like isoform X1 n=1 Tax=Iris pallida TaxID=29817 RepID=A0AAX6EU23_IRIPA|nr:oxysterol-binding protein-related protein 2A-like isoform X1 [Iris pallida]